MAWLEFVKAGMGLGQASAEQDIGAAQDASAKMAAIHTENEANQAQAVAQRAAIAERRRARYIRSRALAVAGASGGGVSDPSIQNELARIDTEGDVNFMHALFTGDYSAARLRREAQNMRREGRAYRANAYGASGITALNALGNFAGENQTFFSKYGGDKAESVGMGTAYSDFARDAPSGFDYIDGKSPGYYA